ncbi:hypothetical protein HYX18_03880 [Candidatus Woesearchaeota archaeon]|nr:hypothetical protein [Candidatus Woesearchaeota archaeon]
MKWDKINTILVVFMLIIIAYFIFSVLFSVNCKQDRKCFDKRAASCMPASYLYENQENIFQYNVIGSSFNHTCAIGIKLLKTSPLSSLETKQLFEGKSMTCKLPKEQLLIASVQETSNILNYCTGPLKEATLELMIKKLYGTIAQNLGAIINQISKNQTINQITNSYETSNGSVI